MDREKTVARESETPAVIESGKIQQYQRKFARDRDWEKFHTPKNLVMALAGEAGELVEVFQWLSEEQSKAILKDDQKAGAVRHELADILNYAIRLADVLGIDLNEALWEKFRLNEKRYPVELSKGTAKKYTEF